jgi:PAS domain S-box-containing protein
MRAKPLSLRSRTYLLVLLPLAGLAILLGVGLMQHSRTLSEMTRIAQKVDFSLEGGRLIHHVQLERGHSAGWLSHPENGTQSSLAHERDQVNRLADRFRGRLAGPAGRPIRSSAPEAVTKTLLLLDSLALIRERVDQREMTRRASRQFYTRLNGALLHVVLRTAQEGSHPELNVPTASFAALVHLKEAAGIERAILHGALAQGAIEPGVQEDILLVVARQEMLEIMLTTVADGNLLEGIRALETDPISAEAVTIRDLILAQGPDHPDLDAERWFEVQTERIERLRELEVQALRTLETGAVQLERQARTQRNTYGTAGFLFLFLTLAATSTSVRSVQRPLNRFHEALEAMSRGEEEEVLVLKEEGPEEMVAIAEVFNSYVDHLRDLLQRLKVSEAEVRGIFERVPIGLYRTSADGRILEVNPAFAQILGYNDAKQLQGLHVSDLYVNREDQERWRQAMELHGTVRGMELELLHRNGRPLWVEDSARAVRDPETGQVESFEGSLVDITARRVAEAEVRRLSAVVTHSPDAVMITNTGGRIEYVNPAFERLTGYSPAEALGQTPALLQSGQQDQAFYARMWRTILAGKAFQGRFVNRRKDGRLYHLLQTISPIQDEDGQIRHFVASGKDITERVALEQGLQEAQKLESVGELAAGIAHDFNNLLTVILGHLQMALEALPKQSDGLTDELRSAKGAAVRGAELVKQLLAFARKQPVQPRLVDLVETVQDFRKMSRRLFSSSIDVRIATQLKQAWICMDPGQLNQILLNLAINARDAMPAGGTLTIGVDRKLVDQPEQTRMAQLEPGAWIRLQVSDSGVGMDSETQARIFEPFFTTKELGRGTGLGLSTVYGIVAQNHGFIEVESTPGDGTSFFIYLPEKSPEANEDVRTRPGAPG